MVRQEKHIEELKLRMANLQKQVEEATARRTTAEAKFKEATADAARLKEEAARDAIRNATIALGNGPSGAGDPPCQALFADVQAWATHEATPDQQDKLTKLLKNLQEHVEAARAAAKESAAREAAAKEEAEKAAAAEAAEAAKRKAEEEKQATKTAAGVTTPPGPPLARRLYPSGPRVCPKATPAHRSRSGHSREYRSDQCLEPAAGPKNKSRHTLLVP
jgi:hypothetical protein